MREIRQSGSEGGEAGNLTGLPYPYQPRTDFFNRLLMDTISAHSQWIVLARISEDQCSIS